MQKHESVKNMPMVIDYQISPIKKINNNIASNSINLGEVTLGNNVRSKRRIDLFDQQQIVLPQLKMKLNVNSRQISPMNIK